MIIDNVKVYTPDQKFVEGGLVLDQDPDRSCLHQ